jgi:hypothetical protein
MEFKRRNGYEPRLPRRFRDYFSRYEIEAHRVGDAPLKNFDLLLTDAHAIYNR